METAYTALEEGVYKMTLDSPFVYAVIDDAAGLPVFIGTVADIGYREVMYSLRFVESGGGRRR